MKIVNFKHSHAPEMWLFRTFVSLQSEKSQVWSFSVSYSIRNAAEIWHTSHIFLGFESENSQVWSISILYFIQHAVKPAFNKDVHLISLWILTSVCFYLVLFVTLEENDKLLFTYVFHHDTCAQFGAFLSHSIWHARELRQIFPS